MTLAVIDTDFSLPRYTSSPPLNLRLRLTTEPNREPLVPTNRLPMLRDLVKIDAELLIAFLAAVIFFCFFVSVFILYVGLIAVFLGLHHQSWCMQEELEHVLALAVDLQSRINHMERHLEIEYHLWQARNLGRRPTF